MNLFAALAALPYIRYAAEDWEKMVSALGVPTPDELAECAAERGACVEPRGLLSEMVRYPVVEFFEKAANNARYRSSVPGRLGRLKVSRYPPVDLARRKIILTIHQAGVERSESRWGQTAWRVSAQRCIGPTGTRYRNFRLNVRLITANRMDRSPYHGIGFEVLGNFEGVAGSGNWYEPERFGYGVLGEVQANALYVELHAVIAELRSIGLEVYMIAPHIIAGVSRSGRPNRQLCCGSAVWAVAERVAAETQIPIPGPKMKFGGLPLPEDWHSEFHGRCQLRAA